MSKIKFLAVLHAFIPVLPAGTAHICISIRVENEYAHHKHETMKDISSFISFGVY